MGAWIKTADESGALAGADGHGGDEARAVSDEARAALGEVARRRGKVARIWQAQALLPGTIGPHLELYESILFGPGPLERDERELIAVVVSAMNDCEYCVEHHARALDHYWRHAERVATAKRDFRKLPIPRKLRLLLEYAEQLTHKPLSIDETIIAELREAGASDAEILQTALITSYFNFANRLAMGLCIESDGDEAGGYRY